VARLSAKTDEAMKWTRIADTELATEAWKILDSCDLEYHNGWHVQSMYEYLHDTNEPYDECLDWAVLFHDIIYDDQPEKELRSAKMFVEMVDKFQGCKLRPSDQARVYSLIMRTVDHIFMPEIKGSSAIIRADLHALTSPQDTFYNFYSILNESMYLYKIDEVTFANNNINFMEGLFKRVDMNIDLDPTHADFYKDVKRGITSTINLSRILKGEL
jgi:predicted metal-dependent HD superfamily phosphohydrolase